MRQEGARTKERTERLRHLSSSARPQCGCPAKRESPPSARGPWLRCRAAQCRNKKAPLSSECGAFLPEPMPGFEPGTYGLRNRCSTTELHRRSAAILVKG